VLDVELVVISVVDVLVLHSLTVAVVAGDVENSIVVVVVIPENTYT